jgi:hypothetical protein
LRYAGESGAPGRCTRSIVFWTLETVLPILLGLVHTSLKSCGCLALLYDRKRQAKVIRNKMLSHTLSSLISAQVSLGRVFPHQSFRVTLNARGSAPRIREDSLQILMFEAPKHVLSLLPTILPSYHISSINSHCRTINTNL